MSTVKARSTKDGGCPVVWKTSERETVVAGWWGMKVLTLILLSKFAETIVTTRVQQVHFSKQSAITAYRIDFIFLMYFFSLSSCIKCSSDNCCFSIVPGRQLVRSLWTVGLTVLSGQFTNEHSRMSDEHRENTSITLALLKNQRKCPISNVRTRHGYLASERKKQNHYQHGGDNCTRAV